MGELRTEIRQDYPQTAYDDRITTEDPGVEIGPVLSVHTASRILLIQNVFSFFGGTRARLVG